MSKTKKIAFILPSYVGGGAEKVIDTITEELSRNPELEFHLITSEIKPNLIAHAKKIGINIIQLINGHKHISTETTNEIISIINSYRFNTVIIAVDPLKNPQKLRKEIHANTKLIFHLHGQVLWEVTTKLNASKTNVLKKNSRFSYLKWFLLKYCKERFFKAYTRRYLRIYNQTIETVDFFWVLCDSYRDELITKLPKKFARKYSNKIIAMYNPINISNFPSNLSNDKLKEVVYVGRLSRDDKRVDRLINIWSKIEKSHPDWILKIIGDGDEKKNLINQSISLNLNRVKFLGYDSEPQKHYRTASILCLTSAIEGWGLVLIEAITQKVIPMAFSCSSGVSEILSNGRGVAVTPFDEDEYATKLHELMTNEELRKKLLQNAEGYSIQFDAKNISNQWLKYI